MITEWEIITKKVSLAKFLLIPCKNQQTTLANSRKYLINQFTLLLLPLREGRDEGV